MATGVTAGPRALAFTTSRLVSSAYADFTVTLPGPKAIRIRC